MRYSCFKSQNAFKTNTNITISKQVEKGEHMSVYEGGELGDYTPKQVIKVLNHYAKGRAVKKEDSKLLEILSSMNLVRFGRDHNGGQRVAMTTDMGCSFAGR